MYLRMVPSLLFGTECLTMSCASLFLDADCLNISCARLDLKVGLVFGSAWIHSASFVSNGLDSRSLSILFAATLIIFSFLDGDFSFLCK